jgi:putative membrane protein
VGDQQIDPDDHLLTTHPQPNHPVRVTRAEPPRATVAAPDRTLPGGEMLAWLAIRWLVLAVAIGVTAALLPKVEVNGGGLSLIWIALVFSLVNVLLGTVLRLLALPLTVITFGLFALVVNAVLVVVTDWLTDDLTVHGFFPALFAAILISVISTLLNFVLRPRGRMRPA